MLQFLGNEDTWRTLRAISRNRRCPLLVAVPYLGNGGSCRDWQIDRKPPWISKLTHYQPFHLVFGAKAVTLA